jgi:DNA-binding protein H-NS
MRRPNFEAMDFDELWLLHEDLTKLLAERIGAEKRKLESRLTRLARVEQLGKAASPPDRGSSRPRRKYPKVLPKYFNPSAPAETWSGRGRQPRWIVAALKSGRKLEEFRISDPGAAAGSKARRRRRS